MAIQRLPTVTIHQSDQPLAIPTYPPIYTSSQISFTSDKVEQKHFLIGFPHWVLFKSLRWNGKWQYQVYLPPQSTSQTNLWLYLPTHQFTPAHSSSSDNVEQKHYLIGFPTEFWLNHWDGMVNGNTKFTYRHSPPVKPTFGFTYLPTNLHQLTALLHFR